MPISRLLPNLEDLFLILKLFLVGNFLQIIHKLNHLYPKLLRYVLILLFFLFLFLILRLLILEKCLSHNEKLLQLNLYLNYLRLLYPVFHNIIFDHLHLNICKHLYIICSMLTNNFEQNIFYDHLLNHLLFSSYRTNNENLKFDLLYLFHFY